MLESFRHLRSSPDFQAFIQILQIRRVAEGERRINDMLRGTGARGAYTPEITDLGQWAREVSYWRGVADGLDFAATIVEKTIASAEAIEVR